MQSLNIDKIGPGGWYMIHMMAAKAKSQKEIEAVHTILEMVSKYFFCLRCREHFKKNLLAFPPPKVNEKYELFIWSVEMHNKVNRLNDKPVVCHLDALDTYIGSNATCTGDCGAKNPIDLTISQRLIEVLTSNDTYKFRSNNIKSL